jgi:K+-transporting ATPase ATPase C chain
MRRQLLTGLLMTVCLTVILGLGYPLLITGISQVAFHSRANGSVVDVNGTAVGSSLIGQNFTDPKDFQPRPSAAGDGYDATKSGGSNLGPSNPTLSDDVSQRVADYRKLNGLADDVAVPVDAVTASGSGLDPDISIANARLQAPRVAKVRGLPTDTVQNLVDQQTQGRDLGFLGEPTVNVLELNLALDQLAPGH